MKRKRIVKVNNVGLGGQFSGSNNSSLREEVARCNEKVNLMRLEVSKAFFGHDEIVNSLIRALICDAHVLVEGVPGIAKTLLVKSLAKVSGCSVSRIQYTVDLLPADILGLTTYSPRKGFEIVKGPIFSNFVIADEINRAPPKTQSASIEAMQERQVTIGRTTFKLPEPFFVMATQNPLENEGVYELPEAQIDRFLFKVIFGYPKVEDELRVMDENSTYNDFESYGIRSIVSSREIIKMQKLAREIYVDEAIKRYILAIIGKTRDKEFKYAQYIELGASPRASIGIYAASKAEALMNGRDYVIPADIVKVCPDVLRHRLILSYRAHAEKIDSDFIIQEILKEVQVP